jgi:ligand-binding SRPBCC domain-containing protein
VCVTPPIGSGISAHQNHRQAAFNNQTMAREFLLRDEIAVDAPIERCFQLSTSLALVELDLKMRPVSGRITGFVAAGDTVLSRGWKFGLPQMHRSLIDGFDAPVFFRDRMIAERFASFSHEHRFLAQADGSVLLRDEIRFRLPCGALGVVAGRLLLLPHLRSLLRRRLARIKSLAESEEWRRYLPQA